MRDPALQCAFVSYNLNRASFQAYILKTLPGLLKNTSPFYLFKKAAIVSLFIGNQSHVTDQNFSLD